MGVFFCGIHVYSYLYVCYREFFPQCIYIRHHRAEVAVVSLHDAWAVVMAVKEAKQYSDG